MHIPRVEIFKPYLLPNFHTYASTALLGCCYTGTVRSVRQLSSSSLTGDTFLSVLPLTMWSINCMVALGYIFLGSLISRLVVYFSTPVTVAWLVILLNVEHRQLVGYSLTGNRLKDG